MERDEIRVVIDPEGEVSVEVVGAVGKSCVDLTRPLEQALGGSVEDRELKPEYRQSSPATAANRISAKEDG